MRISPRFGPLLLLLPLLTFGGCDFIEGITGGDDDTNEVALFPVRLENEWGFINQHGRMMIEPEFDSAQPFVEGVARIRQGGVGYIDPNGDWVVQPRFSNGRDFSEGLAAVELDGRWGYIGRDGSFAINPQYIGAFGFKEGRAFVQTPDDGWQYIDRSGNVIRTVSTPELDLVEGLDFSYNSGRALVWDRDSNQYGYLDKNADIAIDIQYTSAHPFSEGVAAIKIADAWGFINNDQETVINPRYIEVGRFGDGLVPARENTNTWGYADKKGRMVIEPQYEEARPFSEGRAAVKQDGFWGFIDRSGTLISAVDFDNVSEFRNGLAAVEIEILDPNNENNRLTKYGYLGRDGKYVWFPTR